MELGVELEQQTQASLAGLRTLFRGLAGIPGRKYVVLVSAGVLVSDRLDGRPDVSGAATVMGQEAAQAQAMLYTVHLDLNSASPDAASKRGSANSEQSRDRAMFGNWLDDFSRSAGGMRIYVPVGDGAFAFDRVLRESSAYYLLGVEPAEADRDGRPAATARERRAARDHGPQPAVGGDPAARKVRRPRPRAGVGPREQLAPAAAGPSESSSRGAAARGGGAPRS